MYAPKTYKHELVETADGWEIRCDGFPLWRGLDRQGAENILFTMGVSIAN
jgi:hypothetical protein